MEGELAESGSVEGMAGGMDFGFIKEEMAREIDGPCDHGLILWIADPFATLLETDESSIPQTKLYFTSEVPTAENLARHWYLQLAPKIFKRSNRQAHLVKLRVYETPNCWADYEPGEGK